MKTPSAPMKKGKDVPAKNTDTKPHLNSAVKLHGKWDRENVPGPTTSKWGNDPGASTSSANHSARQSWGEERKRRQSRGLKESLDSKEAWEVNPDPKVSKKIMILVNIKNHQFRRNSRTTVPSRSAEMTVSSASAAIALCVQC
jgi:hypothetical protein